MKDGTHDKVTQRWPSRNGFASRRGFNARTKSLARVRVSNKAASQAAAGTQNARLFP
jgi:hypothetical protein